MQTVTMYTTTWCPDCYNEINIEEDEIAEAIVIKANNGKRKVPTLKVGERYFACSPFNAVKLAAELNVPLNP
jgi:glutaredoxin